MKFLIYINRKLFCTSIGIYSTGINKKENSLSGNYLEVTGLERKIIKRIKEGDDEAFAILYHQYANYALRVGLAVTRSKANSADAVQETFIRVYGQATIDRIRTLFEPEKKVVEQIEGSEEEKEYTLKEGEMGYIIYVDQSMHEKEVVEGRDRIVPLYKADDYPAMYMEISQNINLNPEEAASQIEKDLKEEYNEFENHGIVSDPIDAIHLSAKTGINHDDILVKYYLVDNTRGGSFVIKMEYTYEAAEGHGARFYHMLQEFEVVDLEDM